METGIPTGPFTIEKSQDQENSSFYVVQERHKQIWKLKIGEMVGRDLMACFPSNRTSLSPNQIFMVRTFFSLFDPASSAKPISAREIFFLMPI